MGSFVHNLRAASAHRKNPDAGVSPGTLRHKPAAEKVKKDTQARIAKERSASLIPSDKLGLKRTLG